ncbi:MAG TPA: phosphatidate cytidylyltransferase [Candidatus Nitrosotenuis sp.]|nr:phosphatidate cytidylyltransferase [Candidatus Nitrosotenuis sp.]
MAHKVPSNLYLRTVTALVGIPIIIFTLWLGKPYFDALALVILFLLIREWARMSQGTYLAPLPYVLALLLCATLYGGLSVSKATKYAGFILAGGFFFNIIQRRSLKSYAIHVLGSLYILASVFLLIHLVHEGLEFFFLWLLIIVWAADTGAYFIGRKFGGVKLAPVISPNKTWSGFIGGLVTATLAGVISGPFLQDIYSTVQSMFVISMILGIVSHLGDLLESMTKRYYNVKDTGHLLPGHGGLLDRLDSILLVSLAAGLMLVIGF